MAAWLLNKLKSFMVLAYGFTGLLYYGLVAVRLGYLFKEPTEKENLELQIARDKFWNLSKDCGFKFHYVCNDSGNRGPADQAKPVVVFIHGFPDSWAIWRHVLSSSSLQESATLVAVDMPGYGGSDSFEEYSATNVLESLTEFVIAIRAKYGVDTEAGPRQKKLDYSLPRHSASNVRRLISTSVKMVKTASRDPIRSRSMFSKAFSTLGPVFRQVWRSKYIFAFQLPMFLVRYLGRGGYYSFLKIIHRSSYGRREFTSQDAAECLASTMGPSTTESSTQTADGEEYPASLKNERAPSSFQHMACYYRDGTSIARWNKSVETITDLHSISGGNGAGLFDDGPKGALKASATILWGKADIALEPQICLDGISDYLVADSQLVELPLSGHFTPLERESQVALEKAVEWSACYPKAVVTLRK
ncbi:alpha/beta fold family hydrolase [Aspergillus sclerotioniger CBS 115572]|uniref:Alpha/beta fold family hydrolase n=1 Tax=Aspergillus sclerotioniger CBS 115572 TaxID=1450535 RepID=A0A317UUK3_9EURO|nr:alpha/beta fold family hydrolase [Aspergillus sclerotioniger CBS 115572]PWY63720.1 alpha/beta fold family hydrolase [Aspergillus sclerotioniger CBS 115572]